MTSERMEPRHLAPATGTAWHRPVIHGIVIIVGVAMIYPLLWLVSSSFKPTRLIFTRPSIWSGIQTIGNYKDGWSALGLPFSVFFLNSVMIAALSVVGNLLSCSLAAYAFARLEFRFRKVFFAVMLGTIMLPFNVVIVPAVHSVPLSGLDQYILPAYRAEVPCGRLIFHLPYGSIHPEPSPRP